MPGRGAHPLALALDGGQTVTARSVVIASGVRYRRPKVAQLEEFEGRGIWYWASPIEARLCRQERIALVGGGNSAGQAAVYLSGFAAKVIMLVRGASLAESMSRYLVERIAATANIETVFNTEVVGLSGSPEKRLERMRWRNRLTGREEDVPMRNLFLFIGADAATDWLKDSGIALDAKGFVRTGAEAVTDAAAAGRHRRAPLPLESNMPGVFAVGDVRSGSVKRVGAAIGEGAEVVAQLHAFLADIVPEQSDDAGMARVPAPAQPGA